MGEKPSLDLKALTQAIEALQILEQELGQLASTESRARYLAELYDLSREMIATGQETISKKQIEHLLSELEVSTPV